MKEQNQLRRLSVECWLSAEETKQGGLRRPQPLISCGLSAFVLGSLPTFSLSPDPPAPCISPRAWVGVGGPGP